jgi:hypothetical protein
MTTHHVGSSATESSNNGSAGQSGNPFRDLAPTIHRQRLVIEGYPRLAISNSDISGSCPDSPSSWR